MAHNHAYASSIFVSATIFSKRVKIAARKKKMKEKMKWMEPELVKFEGTAYGNDIDCVRGCNSGSSDFEKHYQGRDD